MNCESLKRTVLNEELEALGDTAGRVFLDSALESVSLPSGLKWLECETFKNCKHLKSAVLPQELERIGEDCFSGSGVEEMTIFAVLKELAETALSSSLKIVSVEEGCQIDIRNYVSQPVQIKCFPSRDTIVGDTLLRDLRACKNVVIPEGMQKIGARWFAGSEIETVLLPSTLQEIGEDAFS